MKQLSIDFTGEQMAQQGMNSAIAHSDFIFPDWSKNAYNFALSYCLTHKRFMAEDLRNAADDIIPDPPSKRAWGGIIRKLSTNGIIHSLGTSKVKNVDAHCANANLWEVVRFDFSNEPPDIREKSWEEKYNELLVKFNELKDL